MFDVERKRERERERERRNKERVAAKKKKKRDPGSLVSYASHLCAYIIQNNQISRARAHTHTPVDGLYTY